MKMNIAVLKERLERLDTGFAKDDLYEQKVEKALVLDLSAEGFYDWTIPERLLNAYVSGPALGARIWAEFAGANLEESSTYESDNPVVITSSSISNSGMPGCESVSIAFRSPVSGTLRFNVVSNTFGMRLRAIGYSALVITGRLRRPALIDIKRSGVTYNISEVFIGYTVSQIEKLAGVGPMTTAMSIGPAGEQKVPFAAVVCEGSTTGRGGLGCVFGYKNIKSLCITGFDTAFEREGHEGSIKAAFSKLRDALEHSPYCAAMQRSGSASLIKGGSKKGWAPVQNFSKRTDPRLFHVAGDEINRRYGSEHGGCIQCPLLCKHRTLDGISIPGYDASLMLGPNVSCFDMDKVIERYALCVDLGLDPISTGNVLGWAEQARSCGLLGSLFEPSFSFKDNSKVLFLIGNIARRFGAGEPLSFGIEALGKACGREDISYSIKGLECGPFDYRGAYAQCISDCMGFWFTNYFEINSNLCTRDHADWAVLNESLVMGLESYGVSPSLIVPTMVDNLKQHFKWLKIIPKSDIKLVRPYLLAECISAVTGKDLLDDAIFELGDRCWRLIYEINRMLGFDMLNGTEDLLPEHFRIDPDSNHKDESIVPYRSLMDRYCFLRKQTIAIQSSDLQQN